MKLSQEEMTRRIPSGKHLIYRHRAGWATNELKHAGLVHSPEPKVWTVTQAGRDLVESCPDGISDERIAELRKRVRDALAEPNEADVSAEPAAESSDEDVGPDEQIERALATLRQSAANDLLQRLHTCDPDFFEQVVLDVLHAMGYGASRDALEKVGGSGDGGIDGIISLDRLGLEKVYVQAKRWRGRVGRPEIQGFFGALSGRRARKGVFITTSDFSREAREYASSVSDTLVLVGGRELAHLMIDHGVGVHRRPIYVPQIDSDYFADE